MGGELIIKEAMTVEMTGGEWHGIENMGMIVNESAGDGVTDMKRSRICYAVL